MVIALPELEDRGGGLAAWRCEELAGWSGTLEDVALDVAGGRAATGRARIGAFAAVVRRYRRGGALRGVLPDAFVLQRRALREIAALRKLAPLGLAPRPLALEIRGRVLHHMTLAVEEAQGAITLREAARDGLLDASAARLAGDAVRRMHDAGVGHADLHVGNVLIAGGRVLLVDFDGALLHEDPVPQDRREREVHRLCRSVDKWLDTSSTPAAVRAAFLRAALPRERRRAVLAEARRARRLLPRAPR